MSSLFNDIAKEVSCKMNITYNEIEANNNLKFLKDAYMLPKDAKEIYKFLNLMLKIINSNL